MLVFLASEAVYDSGSNKWSCNLNPGDDVEILNECEPETGKERLTVRKEHREKDGKYRNVKDQDTQIKETCLRMSMLLVDLR